MAVHASHAALPYAIKGARFSLYLPYLDADGDPTAPTTPDTEFSLDGSAATDCLEEASAVSGMDGVALFTVSGEETNGSALALNAKVASGPKATLATIYPRVLATVGSGTLSAGSAGGGTLGTLLAYDVTGCFIKTTGGTGGGGTGGRNNQAREIVTYNTGTGAFTVDPNWETTPDNTTTYDVKLPTGVTLGMLRALNPTTPGRTADVAATGEIGLDFDNIHDASGSHTLTNITVPTVTTVTNQLTAAAIATGVWQDTTAGDFAAVGSIGKSLFTSGNAPGAASGLALVGSNVGTATSVSGAVGSVTGSVGSVTSGGITSASFAAGAIDAAAIATDALGALELAAGAASEIAAAVWDLATSGHTTSGTFGAAMNAAGSAGDPWATTVPGAYGAGTAGFILGTNLNATVTSRMASYTQPTGFLAATFGANVGGVQPLNFTGTGASALVKADVQDFGGTAGTFSGGRPEVNAVGDFTAADRTKLDAVHGKLPTKLYLTGTSDPGGVPDLDTGDFLWDRFAADSVNDPVTAQLSGDGRDAVAAAARDVSNASPAVGSIGAVANAIKAKTDLIPAAPASTTNITAATGVVLAAAGLDAISVADPGAPANHTTLAKMLVAVWRALWKKSTMTATEEKRYANDGTTVNATAALSDDLTTQTRGDFT